MRRLQRLKTRASLRDMVAETGFGDPLAGPLRLGRREGHSYHLHPVVRRSVDCQ